MQCNAMQCNVMYTYIYISDVIRYYQMRIDAHNQSSVLQHTKDIVHNSLVSLELHVLIFHMNQEFRACDLRSTTDLADIRFNPLFLIPGPRGYLSFDEVFVAAKELMQSFDAFRSAWEEQLQIFEEIPMKSGHFKDRQ